jgi:BirA family biotin operon repressor/biotin-[acetyl-CoA-carboxylase] ligase
LAIRIFCSTGVNVGGVTFSHHVRPPGASLAPPPDSGPWPSGWAVWYVEETGSTNDDLLGIASDLPDRTVLRTGHQTAGRGRLDRRWDAPPGANLLVSLFFRTVPDDPGEVVRRLGLAAVGAVTAIGVPGAALKWPNDVLLDGAKLAGVLAQRAPTGEVVAGIGLNIGWAPDAAARLGDAVRPDEVLREMLTAYDALPADITGAYRTALSTIGKRVRVVRPTDELVGTAVDVESDGRLVVVDECAITHRVDVGDVVHLRPI